MGLPGRGLPSSPHGDPVRYEVVRGPWRPERFKEGQVGRGRGNRITASTKGLGPSARPASLEGGRGAPLTKNPDRGQAEGLAYTGR